MSATDVRLALRTMAARVGQPVDLGAGSSRATADDARLHVVTDGIVHLFLVAHDTASDHRPRRLLTSVEAGEAFVWPPSLEIDGKRVDVLITATASTRMVVIPDEAADEYHPVVDTAFCSWLERLVAMCAGPPPSSVQAEADGVEARTVEAGDSLGGGATTTWWRVVSGAAMLVGDDRLTRTAGDGPMPLPPSGWIDAPNGASLQRAVSASVWDDRDCRAAATWLARAAIEHTDRSGLEADWAAMARIELRSEVDADQLDRTISGLVAAFDAQPPEYRAAATGDLDALTAACRIVGAAIGFEVRKPPQRSNATVSGDPIFDIARVSRARVRRITLDGTWWRDTVDPIVVRRTEDRAPLALLPPRRRGRRPRLIDPVARTETALTEEVAVTIDRHAYAFFRALPDRPLTGRDLLRIGFAGVRKELIAVLALGFAGGLLSLGAPIALGRLTNRVIPTADRSELAMMILTLVSFSITQVTFDLTRAYGLVRVENRVQNILQPAVWDRILGLPASFFRDFDSGDLGQRAMGIEAMRQTLTGTTITAILGLLFASWGFVLQFLIDPALGLLAFTASATLLLVTFIAARATLRHERTLQALAGRRQGLILQLMAGITKLRVAAAESRAFTVWAGIFTEQTEQQRRSQLVNARLAVVFALIMPVSTMVMFAIIASRRDEVNAGGFLAFSAAFGQVIAATMAMALATVQTVSAIPSWGRARPILQTPPEYDPLRRDPGTLTGDIEVSGVDFGYHPDDPLVIENVSLRIKPGQFVAFVGPSGAGKSTVFRLLLGFEQPQRGSILYDGQDLQHLDLEAVRRQLGVVLQQSQIMPGEIAQNIVGSSNLTIADAWQAAKEAGLDEDIRRMPMGMHTFIMEGATTISGGQRQRLMIARALARRPRIFLLDEATSALDNETQRIVSESLARVDATRIVVAHRLSTIVGADVIYVMDKGRIVQQGTYDELMAVDGPFRELARRQIA